MKRSLVVLIGLAAMAVFAPPLHATKNCTINLLPPTLDFGLYSPFSGVPKPADASMQVRCNPNLVATVTLTQGTNSTSYTPRTMKLGGVSLPYNLYTSSAGNPPPIWGNGTGGSQVVTLSASPQNKDFNLTIYGILPISGDAAPGLYTDTIAVTVNDDKAGDPDTVMIEIRAQVLAECTVGTFSMNFGTYAPLTTHASSPLTATANIIVKCTRTTIGTVQLNAGQWFAGGVRNLRRASGELLPYNMYRESTYATVWDLSNTVSGASTSISTPLGDPLTGFTIYGRIPANEDVGAGSYTDTVQAIVNY